MKTAKSFTFKVAQATESNKQAKAREGVAVAGCTDYRFPGNLRYPRYSSDDGMYC